jgi:hypothetical protein
VSLWLIFFVRFVDLRAFVMARLTDQLEPARDAILSFLDQASADSAAIKALM